MLLGWHRSLTFDNYGFSTFENTNVVVTPPEEITRYLFIMNEVYDDIANWLQSNPVNESEEEELILDPCVMRVYIEQFPIALNNEIGKKQLIRNWILQQAQQIPNFKRITEIQFQQEPAQIVVKLVKFLTE